MSEEIKITDHHSMAQKLMKYADGQVNRDYKQYYFHEKKTGKFISVYVGDTIRINENGVIENE